MFSGAKKILVIGIEADAVVQSITTQSSRSKHPEIIRLPSWDPRHYTNDPTGKSLFEEIARRCGDVITHNKLHPQCIALTLPGSIQSDTLLSRSSRLGVMQPIDVARVFQDLNLPRVILLRDVDCLAVGEQLENGGVDDSQCANYVYLFVDEGVGSSIFIDGKSYRGAGHAGPIGRLIVEPDGTYNKQFRSRGPLEVFVGRPSISENIVNHFLTEFGKHGDAGYQPFRNAVAAASNSNPRSLPYEVIQQGLEQSDPIAITVVDRAAHYLGIAISAIITILNPPRITLAGGVISNLPSLTSSAQDYARRYSWEHAWNSTSIVIGKPGRDHQYLGAAVLSYNRYSK